MTDADDVIAGGVISLGLGVLAVGMVLLWAIAGALIGAIAGWIIGYTPLGVWIVETFNAFGIVGINTIHIGTTLGFIGGFIKSDTKCECKG